MGIRKYLGLKERDVSPKRPPFWNDHSFSQLQQDRWVLEELAGKCGGFFVEIGAFDGKDLSNTYLLESEYGWDGILAEPNPLLAEGIRLLRKAALCTEPVDAVTGRLVTMRFLVDRPDLSSISDYAFIDQHADARRKESVEVIQKTISLNDLLAAYNAPNDIDFISIDTEGNESDILSAFNFDHYDVGLFCIEHNYTDANRKLDNQLLSQGYERVYRDWSKWDAWYRKS